MEDKKPDFFKYSLCMGGTFRYESDIFQVIRITRLTNGQLEIICSGEHSVYYIQDDPAKGE